MRIGEATNLSDLVWACEQARQHRLGLRRGHEVAWWQNIALLAGDHWARWDPSRGEFHEPHNRERRPRLTLNHALTVKRTELAKITKQRPRTDVVPNSDESVDIAAAKVGQKVLEAIEWQHRLRQFRKRAISWALSTGVSGVYVGWDPDNDKAGRVQYMIDPNTKEPVFNEARQGQLKKMFEEGQLEDLEIEEFPYGDLEFCLYTSFQLLPDETKLEFNEIRDLITTDVVNLDEALSKFGNVAKKLQADQVQLGTIEKRLLNQARLSLKDADVKDAVQIHTFYLLPGVYSHNKFLKDGAMVKWANGDIDLQAILPFPYEDNRMPFAWYQHIPSDASIWPETTVQHIREVNLEMDKTVSQIVEAKDFMAAPMWMYATQHQIRGGIKSRPGGIIKYTHVPNIPPPQIIEGSQLPPQVENLVAVFRNEILDISGQGETSRGRVPSGVRSGVAVAYLQEEDETRLGPTTEDFEESTALMGSLILSRVGQYYYHERVLRLYRRDGMFDVLKFKGADLKGNTDVIPVYGSALAGSKAARQQFILDLAGMGIEQDPKRIRDMLELGQGEPDEVDLALDQAQRENMLMLHGHRLGMFKEEPQGGAPPGYGAGDEMGQQPGMPGMPPEGGDEFQDPTAQPEQPKPLAVPVARWHNHEAHLRRHYGIMMTEDFERIVKKDPRVGQLFEEHTGLHQQHLMELQMQMQQAAMAMKGAPGSMAEGSGEPSQESPDSMDDEADLREQAT